MRPTPSSITTRGPRTSINRPSEGLRTAETRKPKENAPAVTPRSQPNSSRIGGEGNEKGGRAVTPPPLGRQGTGTRVPPQKKGGRGGAPKGRVVHRLGRVHSSRSSIKSLCR